MGELGILSHDTDVGNHSQENEYQKSLWILRQILLPKLRLRIQASKAERGLRVETRGVAEKRCSHFKYPSCENASTSRTSEMVSSCATRIVPRSQNDIRWQMLRSAAFESSREYEES